MSHRHHSHDHGTDGHDHGDAHHDHDHDHSDETNPALQNIIWKQIDFDNIRTLNESESDSGLHIIKKPWDQRLDAEPELISDADEQLLIFIPFAGVIKLHSILFRTSDSPSAPQTIHLHINKDDLDFSTASDVQPVQSLNLVSSSEIQEHPVKRALFNNVYSLTMFVEDNHGDDVTRISWIGFKGNFMSLNREPVEVLYEKAANPKDHEMIAGVGERGMLGGQRHGL